jgi:hypothetical protein
MTTEQDPRTRIVLSWLREDTHENAERMLLRALDEVDTTPQRRSWWPAWRTFRMPTSAKLLAAAAAVLVFAIAGYQVVPAIVGPGATPTPTVGAPAVGPWRNGAIAVAKDGDILVADRPGGDLRPLVVGPEDDSGPMFSPDGTRLAFVRHTSDELSFLMVADADGTDAIAFPLPASRELGYWSFAPDGRSLMGFGRADAGIFIRPVDPAAAPTVLDVQLGGSMILAQSGGPSFNPTNANELLVLGQREVDGPRGIYVYDLATGGFRTVVGPVGDDYFFDAAWLADGRITYRGASSVGYSRVVAADGSGGQGFDGLRGQLSPISNDGTRIVAERGGEGVESPEVVIAPIDGQGEPVVLACGPGTGIECPQPSDAAFRRNYWVWSPDDSMLIWVASKTDFMDTYLLVDTTTGHVIELVWPGVGTPAWQRLRS